MDADIELLFELICHSQKLHTALYKKSEEVDEDNEPIYEFRAELLQQPDGMPDNFPVGGARVLSSRLGWG